MQGGHERAEEAGSEEGEDEGKRRTGEGYQGLILNLVLINRNGEVLWGTFFFDLPRTVFYLGIFGGLTDSTTSVICTCASLFLL